MCPMSLMATHGETSVQKARKRKKIVDEVNKFIEAFHFFALVNNGIYSLHSIYIIFLVSNTEGDYVCYCSQQIEVYMNI